MTSGHRVALSRRSLLWAAAASTLAGCATPRPPQPPQSATGSPSSASSTGATSPGGTPSSQAAPPVDVEPYAVLPGEVEPACKLAAVRALEAALTWRDGASGLEAAQERLVALGVPATAPASLAPLLEDGAWSSLRITYPQYGGLLADTSEASVMIAAERLSAVDAGRSPESLTVDTRLVRRGDAWQVTEQALALPAPAAPGLTDAARAVLDHDRIDLPAAARADVEAGIVDDLVLSMLAGLAEQWRVSVLVFTSGHPLNVFGTDRQSNHTRGRAVDIWAIDDVPVIDRARSPWREVMEAAAALGSDEIGGPKDLDGVRGRRPYFADHVHQDHLHLGFEPPG